MQHSPGLATSLAMQAYLRHHGSPVCLHALLVQAMRQQCQRSGAASIAARCEQAEAAIPAPETPTGPVAPS